MARSGLQPRGAYFWSTSGRAVRAYADRLQVPNIVGSFSGTLRAYWEQYGLGQRCLLASESKATAATLHLYYPETTFVTSDLFPELHGPDGASAPDFEWDVCSKPSAALLQAGPFDSVVAHALLEHVIAPTFALANFLSLLSPGGHLYFMTHTPSYHKHQYPRDYVRFHHDYFEDIPAYLLKELDIDCQLLELDSEEGVVCGVYRRAMIQPNMLRK